MTQTTFPQLLLQHAKQRPTAPALREKEYGIWQTTTWADLAHMVEHVACGLHQAGLQRGEHLVDLHRVGLDVHVRQLAHDQSVVAAQDELVEVIGKIIVEP